MIIFDAVYTNFQELLTLGEFNTLYYLFMILIIGNFC